MESVKLQQKRDAARALCAKRNLSIRPYGHAWWISGVGVSFIVCDLAWVTERDLEPVGVIER